MKQIVGNKSIYEVPQQVISVEHIVFEGFTTTEKLDRNTIVPIFSIIGYPGFRRDREFVEKGKEFIFSLSIFYHCYNDEDKEYFDTLDFISIRSIISARMDMKYVISPITKLSSQEFMIHIDGDDTIYQLNFTIQQIALITYIDNCIMNHEQIDKSFIETYLYAKAKPINLNTLQKEESYNVEVKDSYTSGGTIGNFHIVSEGVYVQDAPFLNDLYIGSFQDTRFLHSNNRDMKEIFDILTHLSNKDCFIAPDGNAICIHADRKIIEEDIGPTIEKTFTYVWFAFNDGGTYLLYCNHITYSTIVDMIDKAINKFFEKNKSSIPKRIKQFITSKI